MEPKQKILIVEDEQRIANFMRSVLTANQYDVITAVSGREACSMISSHCPDLIILDLGLPDMDGMDIIRSVRTWTQMPIVVVSARTHERDKVGALDAGADDYVTKPFRPQILGAKVKALIRRSKSFSQENNQQISCGPFLCDTTTMRFYKNNVELNLSEKERSLLLLFVRHPQQVFTKDMIYEQISGNLIAVDDNAIMVYINCLRSKIEDNARTPQHIITIRGVGYRFVP